MNARLPFISVDVWYSRLPNNTAVLTVGTKIALLLTTAYSLQLTDTDLQLLKETKKTANETYIYAIFRFFRLKKNFDSCSF